MRRVVWQAAVLISLAFTSPAATREVLSQAVITAGQGLAVADHGYLIQLSDINRSAIEIYKPDGSRAFDTDVRLPQGEPAWVSNASVDTDGTVAACESHLDGKTRNAGIAILDATGAQKVYFSTGSFVVRHLAFAPDHSLWGFGYESTAGGGEVRMDYRMLRKYSIDGKELAAYFPRSLYPRGLSPAGSIAGTLCLLMSNDRIGLMAMSGQTSENPEWVEFDFDGKLLGRWRIDGGPQLIAFTANGNVYKQHGGLPPLVRLNHVSGIWEQVPQPAGAYIMLGAEGNDLEFILAKSQGLMQLGWFPAP